MVRAIVRNLNGFAHGVVPKQSVRAVKQVGTDEYLERKWKSRRIWFDVFYCVSQLTEMGDFFALRKFHQEH